MCVDGPMEAYVENRGGPRGNARGGLGEDLERFVEAYRAEG